MGGEIIIKNQLCTEFLRFSSEDDLSKLVFMKIMELNNAVKHLEKQRDYYYEKRFEKGLTKEEIESFKAIKNEVNEAINSLSRKWLIDYTKWILSLDLDEPHIAYELLDIYLGKTKEI